MVIVDYQEYNDDKQTFFRKHDNDFEVETSGGSAEYYTKTYVFKDGAVWYEVMMKRTITKEVIINKCEVKVEVELLETEYWNNEESSKYYYEQWNQRRR